MRGEWISCLDDRSSVAFDHQPLWVLYYMRIEPVSAYDASSNRRTNVTGGAISGQL